MTGFLLTAKQKLMLCINKRLYRGDWAHWADGSNRRDWAHWADGSNRRDWAHRPDRPLR